MEQKTRPNHKKYNTLLLVIEEGIPGEMGCREINNRRQNEKGGDKAEEKTFKYDVVRGHGEEKTFKYGVVRGHGVYNRLNYDVVR